MTKKVKRYSEEFKAEAVKAIENNGGNVSGTARQLGLPMQKLANWQRKANQGKLKGTKQFDSELMAVIEENKRLKRELKIAQEEREILKKATAYFARNGQPNDSYTESIKPSRNKDGNLKWLTALKKTLLIFRSVQLENTLTTRTTNIPSYL